MALSYNLPFKIKINNIITQQSSYIESQYIKSFIFVEDIHQLFCTGELILIDDFYTNNFYNKISLGLDVQIIILNEDQTIYAQHNMRISSFDKVPIGQNRLADNIFIKLVSAWKYNDVVLSKAYQGNSSTIINEVLNEKLPNNIKGINITQAEDNTRIRYRINEKTSDFLLRISEYSINHQFPCYLYTDIFGNINFKSTYDFLTKEPLFVTTSDITSAIKNSSTDYNNLPKIPLVDNRISGDCENTSSKVTSLFSTDGFISSDSVKTSVTFSTVENSNDQCTNVTPSSTTIIPWSIPPDDAYTISVRTSFEQNLKIFFTIIVLRDFYLKELTIGNSIQLLLPYDTTIGPKSKQQTVLGEGKYFVTHIEYIYVNNKCNTKLILIQSE